MPSPASTPPTLFPLYRYHSSTSAANLGYNFTGSTSLRFTIRNGVSATGTPNAHDFYGLSADGKQGDQDLYSGATIEDRRKNWHNLVRYGIARKREQLTVFQPSGELLMVPSFFGPYPDYFGNTVTIRGANGYICYRTRLVSCRHDVSPLAMTSPHSATNFTSSPTTPSLRTSSLSLAFVMKMSADRPTRPLATISTKRTNYQYTLQFQGDFFNRIFYSVGGGIIRNDLFGTAGTPRFGLAYVPVRPGNGFFHGTKLRANAATGVQEPSLSNEFNSLYKQLADAGASDLIAAYNVRPIEALRSRTFDARSRPEHLQSDPHPQGRILS